MTRPIRAVSLLLFVVALTSACAAPMTSTPSPAASATAIGGGQTQAPATDPGGTTEPPTSPADGQATVEGSILDPGGQPVPDPQVSVTTPGTDTASCCAEITAPGRFRVTLPPGDHELQFAAAGFLPVVRQVTAAAGDRLVVDVVMTAGEPSAEPRTVLKVVRNAPAGVSKTVEEVVSGGLTGRLTVTGALIGKLGGTMELCSAVLESFPPQCGRPSIVLEGLQVGLLQDLQQANGVVWLDQGLTVTGDVTSPGPTEGANEVPIRGTVFTLFRDGRRCADQDPSVVSSLSGIVISFADASGGIHASAVTGDLMTLDLPEGCRFSTAYATTLPRQPTYHVDFEAPEPVPGPGGGYFDGANQLTPVTIPLSELRARGFSWDFEAPPGFVVP